MPIFVTENGLESDDEVFRSRHLTKTIADSHATMAGGVPVLGYIHWSFMDNFEWRSGYHPRFGLYAVDRTTFVRRAKPPAATYRRLLAAAGTKTVNGRL